MVRHVSAEQTLLTVPDADPSRPELFLRFRPAPDDAPAARPAIVVVHGYGEHSGRYTHVIDALQAAGHPVCALDRRGFGRSGGRRAFVRRFSDYLDDLDWAFAQCRRMAAPDLPPPILLGHSEGGLIAAAYALQRGDGLGGLVLSSPALRFRVRVPWWKHTLGLLASRVWPTLALPAGIDPEHLSRDPRNERELRDDPLAVSEATARWYVESQKAQQRVMTEAERLTMPTLFLVAGSDHVVDAATTRAFHDRAVRAPRTWRLFDEGRHELFQELPELQAQVLAELTDWLSRTF